MALKYEEAVDRLDEILPRNGMTYTEESQSMVFCKPKIMPLKSVTLEKLEKMQREAQELMKLQEAAAAESAEKSGESQ